MAEDRGHIPLKRWILGGLALVAILACAFSFTIRPDSSSASDDTESMAQLIAGGPSAQAEAQGLVMTLQLSPQPYFIGELVAAEMTLTNNSTAAYTLQGLPGAAGCEAAMWTKTSGGGPPTYTLPTDGVDKCLGGSSTISPGQIWTTDDLFPLTDSGAVTLQAQARFCCTLAGDGTEVQVAAGGPFAQQWPALNLSVAPTPPPGTAAITLLHSHWLLTKQVAIDAPVAARSRLYYIEYLTCHEDSGDTLEPRLVWQSLAGNTLNDPGCPGSNETWSYSVGAPGYEIASGTYPANG